MRLHYSAEITAEMEIEIMRTIMYSVPGLQLLLRQVKGWYDIMAYVDGKVT
jgi:hypothetical protein